MYICSINNLKNNIMEQFKGTQGDWEFVEYHSGELIGVRVISDSENENIFDTGLRGYIDNETEANYKMGSYAPKMLDALIKAELDLNLLGVKESAPMRKNINDLIKKILS